MTAYIDYPKFTKPGGKKKYSHLVADSLEELHAFALKIGIKRHFFHKTAKHPHYDLTEQQYHLAVTAGAHLVDSRTLIKVSRVAMGLAAEPEYVTRRRDELGIALVEIF